MASWAGWERQLLRAMGLPVSSQNVNSLAEWQRHEGGTAAYNPLNTTQRASGASAYNSVGVRNYLSAVQGINATAKTLRNGHYNDILAALRANQPLGSQASLKVWGTGLFSSKGGGAPAAGLPSDPAAAGAPSPAQPSYTRQDALMSGLRHLAAGDYDPKAMLKALQRAAKAQAAVSGSPSNVGSLTVPVTVQGKATPRARQAASMIQQYIGTPYVWGGSKPGGFDCSGLLQWVWNHLGVSIPRVTYSQWQAGRSVSKNNLRPGDAVFFHMGRSGPEHVGMYIGGGQFVEAPRTGLNVRISRLAGRSDYVGARRYG